MAPKTAAGLAISPVTLPYALFTSLKDLGNTKTPHSADQMQALFRIVSLANDFPKLRPKAPTTSVLRASNSILSISGPP